MAGIYSQGGSAGHRYAGWLSEVEAKNFQFGGKVFNGSPSAIYVGSNLVWFAPGLTGTTQRAILGAFLDDGTAVIKATNAYLNGIAAQGAAGKAKAQALAALINEDPMMVCSLGLEPQLTVLPKMPIRTLKGDGNAYINTEKYITSNNFTEILVRAKFTNVVVGDENDVVTNTAVVAEVYRGYKYTWFVRPWRSWDDVIREAGTAAMTDDTLHILPNGMYIASNPSRFYSQNKEPAATSPFWFFRRPGNLYPYSGGLAIAEVKVDNTYLFSCIPFIRKINGVDKLGMIDVLSDTFYQNAGSGQFAEEFGYMQNGSWVTWTPSTP